MVHYLRTRDESHYISNTYCHGWIVSGSTSIKLSSNNPSLTIMYSILLRLLKKVGHYWSFQLRMSLKHHPIFLNTLNKSSRISLHSLGDTWSSSPFLFLSKLVFYTLYYYLFVETPIHFSCHNVSLLFTWRVQFSSL
jgi:hypothetical protein